MSKCKHGIDPRWCAICSSYKAEKEKIENKNREERKNSNIKEKQ